MSDGQGSPAPELQANRRVTILIQPLLQVKLGLYNLILSFAFAAALLGILYSQWVRFRSWLGVTDIKHMVDSEVARYATDSMFWILLALVVFLVSNTLVSILATHRLVGPTVAFRRHIRALIEGDYTIHTTLREYDAFEEVAEDLNELSTVLQARSQQQPAPAEDGPEAPGD